MGMLATVINSLALSSALVAQGVKAKVLTAIRMEPIGEFYNKWRAIELLEQGHEMCIRDRPLPADIFMESRRSRPNRLPVEGRLSVVILP